MNRVLLIESPPAILAAHERALRGAGHDVAAASTAQEGRKLFRDLRPSLVVMDLDLPDADGKRLMRDMLLQQPETTVITMTEGGSVASAVDTVRAGAYDFILKPISEQRLISAVENALSDRGPDDDRAGADNAPDSEQSDEMIGNSAVMQALMERLRPASASGATVFITGESGTGKRLCAWTIHRLSKRATGPFITLDCGAMPRDLLESEMFGHLKGAFPGALSDKRGAADMAEGGTLFLDKICEMDLNLQTKMLRFLQSSLVQPLGAAEAHKANLRIICATNRDPLEEVRAGRFREDLYYRLYVIPVHMPPLRDRGEDVIMLAEHTLARLARQERRNFTSLSDEVRVLFRLLDWPGNVRQLKNIIRHAVVMNEGPVLTLSMLPRELREEHERLQATGSGRESGMRGAPALDAFIGKTMAEIEQLVIEETIARHGGSVPKAARVLDLSPSTLYRKREAWAKGRHGDR